MAKLKEIEVALGLSVEVKGTWYRPNVRLALEMDEKDSKETRAKVFEQAWKEATEQIEKQITALTQGGK